MEVDDRLENEAVGDGSSREQSHQGHGSYAPRHDAHHHEHDSHHDHEMPMGPEEAVRSLLILGQVALDAHDFESAADAFASILQIEPNELALYNLGSLRARGLGVKQDFMEGARLFHQAELLGNERAGKLCAKCMLDYVSDGFDERSAAELYAAMAVFVLRVYPEAADQKLEVNHGLIAIGSTLLNRGDYAKAAKAFRAAAEFGNDGYAQSCLAAQYSAGAGLQRNDLAALYWFDCAVDNGGGDVALEGRDGLIDAYRQNLTDSEFREAMMTLSEWCETGTSDVPVNPVKAARWREAA